MTSDETLRLEDAVNETCPWSGEPIAADALTRYRGQVVGFCNPGCRDKFAAAVAQKAGIRDLRESAQRHTYQVLHTVRSQPEEL